MSDPPELALRPAADDLDYVERLLADAGLPTDDVREGPGAFHVAVADGERVGCGGLEVPDGAGGGADPAGLLRSVVVAPDRRGEGVGAALCGALVDRARADGLAALYLLTTDAAGFFAEQGFERVERAAVPDPLRATAQFTDLCPASATVMRRRLRGAQRPE